MLEAVEELSPDDQENLLAIMQRRVRDKRRAELVRTVKAARKEFKASRCQPASPDEIMRKIVA